MLKLYLISVHVCTRGEQHVGGIIIFMLRFMLRRCATSL